MIKRYQVTLEKPAKYSAGWVPCSTRAFRTLASAQRAAERMLARHPRQVTRSGGGDRRSWNATITDARNGWTIMHIDAPQHVVPSVGELGYW